jgi:hypothetical protein
MVDSIHTQRNGKQGFWWSSWSSKKYVTQEVIQLVTKDLEMLRFSKPDDNERLG